GAHHVSVRAVERRKGEIGDDLRLEITDRFRCGDRLLGRHAILPTPFSPHKVVGKPRQMPRPSDFVDLSELERSAILLQSPLRTVPAQRWHAEANLGLLFG